MQKQPRTTHKNKPKINQKAKRVSKPSQRENTLKSKIQKIILCMRSISTQRAKIPLANTSIFSELQSIAKAHAQRYQKHIAKSHALTHTLSHSQSIIKNHSQIIIF